jgi:hypothetical protein
MNGSNMVHPIPVVKRYWPLVTGFWMLEAGLLLRVRFGCCVIWFAAEPKFGDAHPATRAMQSVTPTPQPAPRNPQLAPRNTQPLQ